MSHRFFDDETETLSANRQPPADSEESSKLSKDLDRLKKATLGAAASRGRLPQPLFWSLFAAEISRLKREKEQLRAIKALLGDPT